MKAMIVDDNHSVRRSVQMLLESLGHEVVCIAVDGREAIEKFDRARPDFMFIDISMPNVNGLDALREIIAQHSDARVIVFTGGESCQREAYAIGATGYLEKPFGISELEREIGKVIVRRSAPQRKDPQTTA